MKKSRNFFDEIDPWSANKNLRKLLEICVNEKACNLVFDKSKSGKNRAE